MNKWYMFQVLITDIERDDIQKYLVKRYGACLSKQLHINEVP